MPWPRPSTASAVAFCGELVTKSPQKATAEAVEGAPTGRTELRMQQLPILHPLVARKLQMKTLSW